MTVDRAYRRDRGHDAAAVVPGPEPGISSFCEVAARPAAERRADETWRLETLMFGRLRIAAKLMIGFGALLLLLAGTAFFSGSISIAARDSLEQSGEAERQ